MCWERQHTRSCTCPGGHISAAAARPAASGAQGVSAVKWGVDARTLFVGAADHNLRIYGVAAGDAMDAE